MHDVVCRFNHIEKSIHQKCIQNFQINFCLKKINAKRRLLCHKNQMQLKKIQLNLLKAEPIV